MSSSPKIWVLGSSGTNADKNIEWVYSWPNFSDPDIVVLNLTSLRDSLIQISEYEKFREAQEAIIDKFLNGGTVIVITAPNFIAKLKDNIRISNYFLSPIEIQTKQVTEGQSVVYTDNHFFSSYLKNVKKFRFYFERYQFNKIQSRAKSMNVTGKEIYLDAYRVTDKSAHTIGCGFTAEGATGQLIFLPPVTDTTDLEGINKIVECYHKTKLKEIEIPPDWATKVPIFSLDEKIQEITKLDSQVDDLQKKIESVQIEKQSLIDHRRLLFAKGDELENGVKVAFKLLGFDDIKQIRAEDLEDGVIEFKNKKDFQYGIIEVKGSENRTSLANLTQCNKWAEDYLLENKTAKGIFIPNQQRLKEYPSSKTDKLHFEPNELEYASKRQICIIPSCVLFEAVNKKLAGKGKTRDEIENLIQSTDGLLSEL